MRGSESWYCGAKLSQRRGANLAAFLIATYGRSSGGGSLIRIHRR